jgi:hypothetical protein
MTMDRDLNRRVSEPESSFACLTKQIKDLHDDLLTFRSETEQRFALIDGRFDSIEGRFDRIEGRFDKVDCGFERIEGRLDTAGGGLARVEQGLQALRCALPEIVRDAMRAVLRERGGTSRAQS